MSHTDGKKVFDSLWLFMYISEETETGSAFEPERLEFSAGLSSDSRNYTHSYSGRMVLTEKSKTRVIIRMENVRFKILYGEYILNGDLVAPLTEI